MIQSLKKEFFAHRNGIVAEALHQAGDPHEIIMGCQLADLIAIAGRYEKSAELAQALWNDVKHRECRMAATMLYPVSEFDRGRAIAWCRSVESIEIADVLCHRLLRNLPYAIDLWESLRESESLLVRYTAWRLLLNLLLMNRIEKTDELRAMVEKKIESAQSPLRQVLESIREEF